MVSVAWVVVVVVWVVVSVVVVVLEVVVMGVKVTKGPNVVTSGSKGTITCCLPRLGTLRTCSGTVNTVKGWVVTGWGAGLWVVTNGC